MANQSLQTTDESLQCQNCDKELKEHYDFCPHCGQKTNEELTISVLFYNTISNYFSFDARFLKSFLPLLLRPGYLAKKFLEGKRLLYLHPAQMYLFISVVFFFIISFSTRELVQEANKLNEKVVKSDAIQTELDSMKPTLDSVQMAKLMKPLKDNSEALGLKDEDFQITDSILKTQAANPKNLNTSWDFDKKKVDSLVAAGADKDIIYKEMGMSDDAGFIERRFFARMLNLTEGKGAGAVIQAFFDSIPISMFFLLPLFALILKIFYFNKGKYAHHLVFSFYYFSFLFTVFSILFAVNRFVYDIPDWVDWLIAISTYIYFFIALKRFYVQHWFLTWIKSGVITFVFLLFVIPTAAGLMLVFSFLTS
ncbi:Protein of unknown function [Formosa sp. Hel1_31_208]|uniref:DUF3667 domain-containing protein n=1 Tax=Formosa sp. Hel1_31_208 TaxID=1798225 RepID=UPI00087C777C|nr:DUF3667 domain-containing protein [Formosa sp. Hel1_31_208]SDS45405.1 Protein of unknown function [Formosa sp. Hel1_31_208]